MVAKKPDPPKEWTESDRAALQEMIDERDFEKQLEARRGRITATIKSTAQWVVAVIGGIVLAKESLLGAWTWFKHWITGGP